MTTQTPDQTSDESAAALLPDGYDAAKEMAIDLQSAYRGMRQRGADARSSAEGLEESARRERVLAVEYDAKADVFADHLRTLGIEVTEPAATEGETIV